MLNKDSFSDKSTVLFSKYQSYHEDLLRSLGLNVSLCNNISRVESTVASRSTDLLVVASPITLSELNSIKGVFNAVPTLLIGSDQKSPISGVLYLQRPVTTKTLCGALKALFFSTKFNTKDGDEKELEEEIIPAFKASLPKRAIRARQLALESDYEALRCLCHDLVIGESLGLPEVTSIARAIGAAARSGDRPEVDRKITSFISLSEQIANQE